MHRLVPALLVAALAGCAGVQQTPEQHAMAMHPDACENPQLEVKPVWCGPNKGSMVYTGPGAVGATVIQNPSGDMGGQSVGGAGRLPR